MHRKRKRQSRTPLLETLDGRQLLSVGITPPHLAEVRELALALPTIKGTIYGSVTSIKQIATSTEIVNYTARGKATFIGDGKGSGQHIITSKLIKGHPTNDTYSHGTAIVKGTTDTVAIRYTGSGHTFMNGTFTATMHGTAASIAGQHDGLSGSFTAQLTGDAQSGTFTINFAIAL